MRVNLDRNGLLVPRPLSPSELRTWRDGYGRAPTFAERDLWNSRQRGRATCALFETLCFQNGLGGRRGKERDQRSCGVSLTVAGNDTGANWV